MTDGMPRLAIWILTKRLGSEWREFIIGDLEEEFRARIAVSAPAARCWLWGQIVRCLISPPPTRRPIPNKSPAGDPAMRTFAADVRYNLRTLLRAPSFAIAVIAVLALGVGANTAIFSIVNAVLLRPLPYEQPDDLVRLFHVPPQSTFPGMPKFAVSAANFYDWQRDAQAFEKMAIYRFKFFTLTGVGNAEAIIAGALGDGFFDVVRARPILGRAFLPEEDTPAGSHVVILSNGFWKSRFAGSADVIGRSLTLNGESYTIVGVMPTTFSLKAWSVTAREIWVPIGFTDEERAVRDNHNDQVIARLKSGADLSRSKAEMNTISARLERDHPKENAGWGATVIPLQELIVGDVRQPLIVLLAAVGLVLLIACANVSNLLVARALGRRKELAIRTALGAGRARVLQQLLVEALLLALAGGAAGVLIANAILSAGAHLLANQVPRADEVALDARVLLFALAASVFTGVVAGVLPAIRAGRADVNDALKEGGRVDAGGVALRTRRVLIVCEVALSLVLLTGAGLMLRTLDALRRVDAGFDPSNVLTIRLGVPKSRHETPAQVTAFFDDVLKRLRALPGVEAAAAVDDVPLAGGSQQPIVVDGRAELLPRDQPTVAVRKITPGYLHAMRVPLLSGRDVAENDTDVVLVSRAAAKLLWGDVDPVGHETRLPLESKTRVQRVIGIVGDVRDKGLAEKPVATVYEYQHDRDWRFLEIIMRTAVPPLSVTQAAAGAVHAVDADQPVEDVKTMDDVINETLASQRFSTLLLGLFAAVALALASVGIYSVLSYIVRGRRREIGIRAALGARTLDVVRLIVIEGMTPTVIGVAVGVGVALLSARLLEKLVFGVSAFDPLTLALVAATLLVVAVAASLVPAYRAARLDPSDVLRAD
jgi:predicted permease